MAALAGVLALVLNMMVLRSADDTVEVATAGADLTAGTVLRADQLRFSAVHVTPEVLAGLLTREGLEALDAGVLAAPTCRAAPLSAPPTCGPQPHRMGGGR